MLVMKIRFSMYTCNNLPPQLLDQLPHTVRGVGRELLGSDVPSNAVLSHAFGDLKEQRNRDRMIEYLGYVVVVRLVRKKEEAEASSVTPVLRNPGIRHSPKE